MQCISCKIMLHHDFYLATLWLHLFCIKDISDYELPYYRIGWALFSLSLILFNSRTRASTDVWQIMYYVNEYRMYIVHWTLVPHVHCLMHAIIQYSALIQFKIHVSYSFLSPNLMYFLYLFVTYYEIWVFGFFPISLRFFYSQDIMSTQWCLSSTVKMCSTKVWAFFVAQ